MFLVTLNKNKLKIVINLKKYTIQLNCYFSWCFVVMLSLKTQKKNMWKAILCLLIGNKFVSN